MSLPLEKRDILFGALSIIALAFFNVEPGEAQSHTSGGGTRKGDKRGSSGGGGGHSSGDDHGDEHSSGDDHGDDHADGDDHGSGTDHGSKGKGKGPRYRGGRGVTTVSGTHGHSLEDRVLKWPVFAQ